MVSRTFKVSPTLRGSCPKMALGNLTLDPVHTYVPNMAFNLFKASGESMIKDWIST